MVLWLENTSSQLWHVIQGVYNMTCDSVTFLGNFCHYDGIITTRCSTSTTQFD